ncbi:hypothetical protein RIR_jg770.t1 [Rhizophagus irregularis DAOM 181602=DAOM 197198]|nr:hypothetical protein RIR_jg770.t1 [Rhizophagus irregularis DAOM 181602=DAOM 197198]
MTWVIVRHWTRKFLIVAISSDYFKHVIGKDRDSSPEYWKIEFIMKLSKDSLKYLLKKCPLLIIIKKRRTATSLIIISPMTRALIIKDKYTSPPLLPEPQRLE